MATVIPGTVNTVSPFSTPLTTLASGSLGTQPLTTVAQPKTTQPTTATFGIPSTAAPIPSALSTTSQTSTPQTSGVKPLTSATITAAQPTAQYSAPTAALGSADRTNQLLAEASKITGIAAPTFTNQANQTAPITPAQVQQYQQQQPAQVQPATQQYNPLPQQQQVQQQTAAPEPQWTQQPQSQQPQYSPTSLIGQTPNFSNYVQGSAGAAAGAIPVGQQAQKIAADYGQQIADVGQAGANAEIGYKSTGTTPVGEGNANLIANATSQRQSALAAGESAALQGTGQQLTAQNQAASGLNAAAGQISPQLGQYGQGYYNPLDTSGGAAGGGQYGTGPAAAANVASIQDLTGQINNYAAARSSATSIVQNQLTPFLQQNNVNPSDFNAINKFLQAIGAQTSSPQYKTLKNILTDVAQTYSQVLTPVGQDPSVWTSQTAQGLLDSAASGTSLMQVIDALDVSAQQKIQGFQNTVNQLNSGGSVNPAASTGGDIWSW